MPGETYFIQKKETGTTETKTKETLPDNLSVPLS